MNKKVYKVGLVIALALIISLVVVYSVFANKVPDNHEFKEYMEKVYDVKCLEEECHTFEIEVPSKNETITFSRHSGMSDKTSTSRIIENYYFSEPSSEYYLHLKVEGKRGKFKLIEEENNLDEIYK